MDKDKNKNVRFLPKILIHIVAISFFMIGIVLLHAVMNTDSITFIFFDLNNIPKGVVFDMGLMFIATGFFIEFMFTFRPIHVLTKKKRG